LCNRRSANQPVQPVVRLQLRWNIRLIQEPTLGFWYKFYQGPKGRVQFGLQYSYLTKSAWSGRGGVAAGGTAISPKEIDNMIFTSLRYYIP